MIAEGILILAGLCMGSFIEATSWRIHEQASARHKKSKEKKNLSILHGRSMCTHCQHTLAWYDLIPLASWLSLRGKCRYCEAPIGWHAPFLEFFTAALFVFSYAYWPYQLPETLSLAWMLLAGWLVLLVGLILLAVYDIRWMLLPNRVVYPLQIGAAVYAILKISILGGGLRSVIGVGLAVVVVGGLFWLLYQVSHGEWIGGGDVRLGVALGLIAGQPLEAGLVIFLASVLGSIIGVPLMILGTQGRQAKLPFGPFLITGMVIVVLFGSALLAWYTQRFLAI